MGRLTERFGILLDGHAAQSRALLETVHATGSWMHEDGRRMINTGARVIKLEDLAALSGPVKVYYLPKEGAK